MSKRYAAVLTALIDVMTAPLQPWRRADTRIRVANALMPAHAVATPRGTLNFISQHSEALQFPREFAEREPETLAWIDGFETPCRFWDVGANVGTYALYAALHPKVAVLAFEPSPATYAALARNVEANHFGDRVAAYCIALSADTRLGQLNMSATNAGNSFNSFESVEDCFGRPIDIAHRQAMLGYSIDDFRRRFGLAAPHYLKIDVDGIEEQILIGAAETLADPDLRSALVEIESDDTERNAGVIDKLAAVGFRLALRGANHAGSTNAIFTRS
ncbi:MAG: FkbM family methyltransferase [Alphaproteobacteria bacterium]|nr:FkbM family methyltransferase [Alphaproteobacteria bacterium]